MSGNPELAAAYAFLLDKTSAAHAYYQQRLAVHAALKAVATLKSGGGASARKPNQPQPVVQPANGGGIFASHG